MTASHRPGHRPAMSMPAMIRRHQLPVFLVGSVVLGSLATLAGIRRSGPDSANPHSRDSGAKDSSTRRGALREMAGAIPQATLLMRSEQHGFAKQHAGELQDDVIDFLLRPTSRSNHPTLRNRP